MTVLIGVQLTDRGDLKDYPEGRACEEFEQIGRPMFQSMAKTERDLELNDEFEDEEVNIEHNTCWIGRV